MNPAQRAFFEIVATELDNKRYVDVQGNFGYLLAYVFGLLQKWNHEGYEWIYDRLLELSEAYHNEEKFAWCCRWWSHDCLLGRELYEDFLTLSEPVDPFSTDTHRSNLRCNVYYLLGRPPTAVDLSKMAGFQATSYSKAHAAEFKDLLAGALDEDATTNGQWLDRLLQAQGTPLTYDRRLFDGAPIGKPKLGFKYYCFYSALDPLEQIRMIARQAENRLRDAHSVPRVGEGWLAETALFKAVRDAFPETGVLQHGMPSWLGRQHLDIWIPRWKIAVEYHGAQHFEPVPIFGGEAGHEATKHRDMKKKRLCDENRISLIIATENMTHEAIIQEIRRLRPPGIAKNESGE